MRAAFASEFERVDEVAGLDLSSAYPLVLDIDGTLLRTDLLLETALNYLKKRPFGIFVLLFWFCKGIAHLKYQLASRSELSPELLPVNERLVRYARDASARGRVVVAASAANRQLATLVCSRFDFISEVVASCDRVNLKGSRKAFALKSRFPAGFSYAGDSSTDLAVWREASFGIFAGRDVRLLRKLSKVTELEADLSDSRPTVRHWLKALRLHQWAKNGLVFLPLLLAGGLLDLQSWLVCVGAFIAMGLTASATYIVNDLLDLDADRQHWSKRERPFAAGDIGIPAAAAASVGLLSAGLVLGAFAGGLPVLGALLLYCAVTLAYSLHLKRVPVLDVTVLATLFTLRLALGAVAVAVSLSSWLIVFSMFLFMSLALAKRATEIGRKSSGAAALAAPSSAATLGRGYLAADTILVTALGIATAVAAVQVMVMYLIHDAFADALYGYPQLLWAAPVLIGLWLGRVWVLTGRGILNDDPVVFAVTDRISMLLGAGVVVSFAGAALLG